VALTRYGSGVVLGLFALVPLIGGMSRLRRRLLRGSPGTVSTVATAVMAIFAVTLTAEALGTIGQYRRVSMCLALALVGTIAWFIGEPRTAPDDVVERSEPVSVSGRGARIIAAIAVGIVVASWTTRTIASLRHGMESVDTLWYHMPTAARFVQTGFVTRLHYFDSDPVTVFYPATSPMLHGFGIQLMGNDVLSPFMNLGWLALALLSAWSIGEPYGVAPVTLTGATIVLATPGMVTSQPGGAYTDVVGLALLLAAVALLVRCAIGATPRMPAVAVAALAAGLAAGTKFTLLAPVGVLTLVVGLQAVLHHARARERIREFGTWCGLVFGAGGFFYVRNALQVGNPLPFLSFGPLHLPTLHSSAPTFTVAQYLFRSSIVRGYYLPGLRDSLGPTWWAMIVLTIASSALLFTRDRSPLERSLGIVPVASLVAFLITPQFLGVADHPFYFVDNVRYATPALAVGLCLLPTLPFLLGSTRVWIGLLVLFGLLVATQWAPTIWAWSIPANLQRVIERIGFVDIVGGVVVGLIIAAIGTALAVARLRLPVVALGVVAMTAVVAGYPVQQAYLRRRYMSTPPMPHIYRWAQGQNDQRIALVGTTLQYPLYGARDSNRVQYLGAKGPNSSFTPIDTCPAWRRALNAGGYGWVVIAPPGFPAIGSPPVPREQRWTSSDRHARLVLTDVRPGHGSAVLFQLDGPLDPSGC
jgi:hypothetical protein